MAAEQPQEQLPDDLQVMSSQPTQEQEQPQQDPLPQEDQNGQDLAAAMDLSMAAAEGQLEEVGPASHAAMEQAQGAVPAALPTDMADAAYDEQARVQEDGDPRIAVMQPGLFSTPPSRTYGSVAQGMSPMLNFSPPEELPTQPQVQAPQWMTKLGDAG